MITFQLTRKMTTWFPASQLLLITLFSCYVHCFPTKNGWSQRDPNEYEPVKGGVYSSPETYPASRTPDMSNVASWNAAAGWDPMAASTTTNTVSRTSQPISDISLVPPQPLFQAGELENYEQNFNHGNFEREALSFVPPPPPYQEPGFQAGELHHYDSIYEQGNEERETEEQGLMPLAAYASATHGADKLTDVSMPEGPIQEVGPNQYYLFLTGQLPPGTVSDFQSDYETGRDHWGGVHYVRYHFPSDQLPLLPTQTQEVPSDGLWLQRQDYKKSLVFKQT
ncbi:uncharacterized protein LOC122884351 isoform X2 [Siniperca chuatsi]|uniref:uncharacterized protein LOC122884351 isoform X2 n=1 Tax=Siniperca chuatsi TaxID=119488 RepID=UPI001CE0B2B4|nr:uncharacterized protein LOC122884351 isoform X2 [Siniperca chuatsi]